MRSGRAGPADRRAEDADGAHRAAREAVSPQTTGALVVRVTAGDDVQQDERHAADMLGEGRILRAGGTTTGSRGGAARAYRGCGASPRSSIATSFARRFARTVAFGAVATRWITA
ncbi:hypothetical protein ACFSM7_08925 [Clavibacter michiganensis subsp. tessellarius]|uniref:hypothetical protein n=1 Tax=Clavibacter tessellarius TaxID=31965 RepID=UPI00362D6165